MVRKPAKPADTASEDIPADDTSVGIATAEAAADAHTEGAEPAEQHADTPLVAPDIDGQGPTGGEERSDLPADQLPEAVIDIAAAPAAIAPAGTDVEFLPGHPPAPEFDLMVVCHRKGGRRRAGRRWDEGETPARSADLTPIQLAEIHGDPLFTIFTIDLERA